MPRENLPADRPTPRYDAETGTYRVRWDPGDDRELGTLVVSAVAEVAGCAHTDLTPINEVVDPEALGDLFAPKHDGTPRVGGRVSFTLSNHEVTVRRDGVVAIDPPADGERPLADAD